MVKKIILTAINSIFCFIPLFSQQCPGLDIFPDITGLNPLSNQCINTKVTPSFNKTCNNTLYKLVFEDNFNGNTLDLLKWNPRTGVIRDFSHESEKHWLTPNNIVVSNGTLKIISTEKT